MFNFSRGVQAVACLVLVSCLTFQSASCSSLVKPFEPKKVIEPQENTVTVKCLVPYGQCKIKCWSGDDIIGPVTYEIGEEMAFSFTGLAWTKFWCEAHWGTTAYVTHPAYDAGAPRQSNVFEIDAFGSNLINWTTNLAWRWEGVPPENKKTVSK